MEIFRFRYITKINISNDTALTTNSFNIIILLALLTHLLDLIVLNATDFTDGYLKFVLYIILEMFTTDIL